MKLSEGPLGFTFWIHVKLSLTDQLFSVIHVANVDFAVAYKLGSGDDYLFSNCKF